MGEFSVCSLWKPIHILLSKNDFVFNIRFNVALSLTCASWPCASEVRNSHFTAPGIPRF